MSYRMTGIDNSVTEYPTVSQGLLQNNIIKIRNNENGEFVLTEQCDDYFDVTLSRDEFLAWIEELKALAG